MIGRFHLLVAICCALSSAAQSVELTAPLGAEPLDALSEATGSSPRAASPFANSVFGEQMLGLRPAQSGFARSGPLIARSMAVREPFSGTLVFPETRMETQVLSPPTDMENENEAAFFPAFKLSFHTRGGVLFPETENVIPIGSLAGKRGFWDVQVGQGAVWTDPLDDGWSRATFPFVLVPVAGGDSLAGQATFLYRGHEIGLLRYQVGPKPVAHNAPPHLSAAGVLTPRLEVRRPARQGAFQLD